MREHRRRLVVALIVGALTMLFASRRAAAQSARSEYRGWVGAFAGVTPDSRTLTAGWEAWVSRGFFGVGYQRHVSDDFEGTKGSAHALLPGVIVPYGRVIGRLAGGVAAAKRCVTEGEQSAARTCSTATTGELAASVEATFSSAVGIHISYFTIPNKTVGHSAMALGITVGHL